MSIARVSIIWVWGILLLLTGTGTAPVHASTGDRGALNPTHLMFVGEDLSVLSIASKREERVREAPALATVITRKEILQYGFETLGEAISTGPGFYTAHQDRHTRVYLRGVRDATLFLFDETPFSNDSTNQSPPVDRELSLTWVKRIEIVRGPSSVLWGPDAFSGVVNVVPLSGKDLKGFETGVFGGNPDRMEGFVQYGNTFGGWDAFFSINGNRSGNFRDRFRTRSGEPTNPFEEGTIDADHSMEIVARYSYEDWLTLSGRFSDFKDYYTLKTQGGPVEPGLRSTPFSMIKLNLRREVFGGDLRFHSFFNYYDGHTEEGTDRLSQDNKSYHFELLYDRSFWRKSLLTLGASYRHNNAVEEFLSEDPFHGRTSVRIDYNSDLYSLFGQLRQRWKRLDAWIGGRFDSHSEYDDTFSFRAGSTWFVSDALSFKLLLGTAFRTPANIQATRISNLKAEQVRSIELAVDWSPGEILEFRASAFHKELKDLIQQNSQGVVSNRNTERINGLEMEAECRPFPALRLFANATLLNSSGEPVQLEGLQEDRYDLGPSIMANIGAHMRILDPLKASFRLQYLGEREVARVVQGTDERPTAQGVVLAYLNIYANDLFGKGLTVGVKVDNLFDTHYEEPGNFDLIEAPPITWRCYVTYRF